MDIINGIWYAAEGNWTDAGLSMAGAIPFAGWFATAFKLGRRGLDAASTARAGERTVLSGHGGIEAGDGTMATIPAGTCVNFYCAHGGTISDDLGNAIETGGAPTPFQVARGGDVVPDYYLGPPDGLTIMGNPTTVRTPTRLSDLLSENMGVCDWAACRSVG